MKCPFCAEDIQDEAKKCKHCGEWLTKINNLIEKNGKVGNQQESNREIFSESITRANKHISIIKCINIAIFIGLAFYIGYVYLSHSLNDLSKYLPNKVAALIENSVGKSVTKANYDSIQSGMSYEKVVEIVGSKGQEFMSIGNFNTYMWENSDGSAMTIGFDDKNQVFTKAQRELK